MSWSQSRKGTVESVRTEITAALEGERARYVQAGADPNGTDANRKIATREAADIAYAIETIGEALDQFQPTPDADGVAVSAYGSRSQGWAGASMNVTVTQVKLPE